MQSMEGIVTIVQEARFQLTDHAGVSHLFVLSYKAGAEPDQLEPLRAAQARVRVGYTAGGTVIGLLARSITRLDC